jgi:hypothetical protein
MTNSYLLPSGVVPKFQFGTIALTSKALLGLPFEDISAALARHAQCDWGDVCPEDRAENERAFRTGGRQFSVYHDQRGVKFWIITEADRSATTVVLPDDY